MAFRLGRGRCHINYLRAYLIFDMEIEGTKQAFEMMLQERGIYKKLGVDTSTVANWKTYLKQGKSISLDKMEEMLTKAGATVAQEKLWKVPGASVTKLDNGTNIK
jgi:glutamate synthase domain-containing protein 1